MKKASTQKVQQPAKLGTKRTCPSCGTKFYDFEKQDVSCPKCDTQLDEEALNPFVRIQNEIKRTKASQKPEPEEDAEEVSSVTGSEEVIESVDDLGDDDVVEDIEVVEDDDEEDNY